MPINVKTPTPLFSEDCVAELRAERDELLTAVKVAIRRLEEIQYQKASPKQLEFLREVLARAEAKS